MNNKWYDVCCSSDGVSKLYTVNETGVNLKFVPIIGTPKPDISKPISIDCSANGGIVVLSYFSSGYNFSTYDGKSWKNILNNGQNTIYSCGISSDGSKYYLCYFSNNVINIVSISQGIFGLPQTISINSNLLSSIRIKTSKTSNSAYCQSPFENNILYYIDGGSGFVCPYPLKKSYNYYNVDTSGQYLIYSSGDYSLNANKSFSTGMSNSISAIGYIYGSVILFYGNYPENGAIRYVISGITKDVTLDSTDTITALYLSGTTKPILYVLGNKSMYTLTNF